MFVDDVLLASDGTRKDALKLRDIFVLYYIAIGMLVNVQKYLVSFYVSTEEEVRYFTQLLLFQQIDIKDQLKYRGFYLNPNAYGKNIGVGLLPRWKND